MALFIVTLKLAKNVNHDPRNKVTTWCPVTGEMCTDQTGAHHSVLVEADTLREVHDAYKEFGLHVTRIEVARPRKLLADLMQVKASS